MLYFPPGQLPAKLGYPGKLKQKIKLKKEDDVEVVGYESIMKSKYDAHERNERNEKNEKNGIKNTPTESREVRSKVLSSTPKGTPGSIDNVQIEK